MSFTLRREGCHLGAVETWVFDLDNTLYPASSGLFPLVQARMNEYICRLLTVSLDEARVFANSDPFVIAGARTYDIREWTVMEGRIGVTVSFSDGGVRID